jgi:glutamine synthetase type III
MDEKIKELAAKYEIPEELLHEAIQIEREKVILKNRRLAPALVQLVERFSTSTSPTATEAHTHDSENKDH